MQSITHQSIMAPSKAKKDTALYLASLKYAQGLLPTLGARLCYLRHRRALTQNQLAKRAGTNQAVINKVERGISKRPRCIKRLAKALEVNPAWLEYGTEFAPVTPPEEFLKGPIKNAQL